MYLDNNNNFRGKIKDKTINSFLKMNYKLDTTEERIKWVNEVFEAYDVDGATFYHEYWDEVFDQDRKHSKIDIVIDKCTSTYSTSNIATSLEKVADYILKTDNKKDEHERNYVIYNSEELFNMACKEYNITSGIARINSDGIGDKDDVDAFPIFQLPQNYNIVKDLKIEKEDLKRFSELKDYNDFYEYLRSENNRLWNQSNLSHEELKRKYLIKKIMPELKKDMLIVKKELQRPIIWKAPLSPSGCPSWDELDMFDKKVVKELLRVHKGNDLQDDLTCIIEDLKNLIDKIDFTDKQRKILDMWSCGVTLEDIAKYTKTTFQAVNSSLNVIVNKIIKQYEEEYTDWYYLNICKGEYKKCSKCGEIKLVSNFCKNGNRLRGNCKNCR